MVDCECVQAPRNPKNKCHNEQGCMEENLISRHIWRRKYGSQPQPTDKLCGYCGVKCAASRFDPIAARVCQADSDIPDVLKDIDEEDINDSDTLEEEECPVDGMTTAATTVATQEADEKCEII